MVQELTAAQKKKQKKKAKEKAKKAGDIDEDAPMKKGPVKKESAAVRRLREEMERQKAAHEAAQKAEEERIRLVFISFRLSDHSSAGHTTGTTMSFVACYALRPLGFCHIFRSWLYRHHGLRQCQHRMDEGECLFLSQDYMWNAGRGGCFKG